jgi:hypothetical protein
MWNGMRLVCILLQPIEIKTVILIRSKTDLAIVTTLDQMQGHIGQTQARASGHEILFWKQENRGQTTVFCPLFPSLN